MLSEAVADPEVEAVGEVIVVPRFRAGDDVHRLPGGKVLIGAQRELREPALPEALAHPAEQGRDELTVYFGVNLEVFAGRRLARDDRDVGKGHAELGAEEPLPVRFGRRERALDRDADD